MRENVKKKHKYSGHSQLCLVLLLTCKRSVNRPDAAGIRTLSQVSCWVSIPPSAACQRLACRTLWRSGRICFCQYAADFRYRRGVGLTSNDGVSALAAVVAYGMHGGETMAVVAPLVLRLPAEGSPLNTFADTAKIVLGGLSPVRSRRICLTATVSKLPGITGFFAGKRFVPPVISGLAAIFTVWCCLRMAANRYGYPEDVLAVGGLSERPVVAFGIYGFYRALHGAVWSASYLERSFRVRIGRLLTNAAGQVFHGDIPRYMAGDHDGRYVVTSGFLFKMYCGLPAAAIAIWRSAKPEKTAQKWAVS